MDRNKAKLIAEDMKAALAAVAAKHGVTVKVGGGRFDDTAFTPKVEFAEAGAAEADFTRFAPSFGLQASSFGKAFNFNGKAYTVTGIRLNAPKQPVIATGTDGKTYTFPALTVARNLAAI